MKLATRSHLYAFAMSAWTAADKLAKAIREDRSADKESLAKIQTVARHFGDAVAPLVGTAQPVIRRDTWARLLRHPSHLEGAYLSLKVAAEGIQKARRLDAGKSAPEVQSLLSAAESAVAMLTEKLTPGSRVKLAA